MKYPTVEKILAADESLSKKVSGKDVEKINSLCLKRGWICEWDESKKKFRMGPAKSPSLYTHEQALKTLEA